jgi:hypothetical protein
MVLISGTQDISGSPAAGGDWAVEDEAVAPAVTSGSGGLVFDRVELMLATLLSVCIN